MSETPVLKEYQSNCDDNILDNIENGIFMKEELIITDIKNVLDNDSAQNDSLSLQDIRSNISHSQEIPNHTDENSEQGIVESKSRTEDDDIIIISEEKRTETNKNTNTTKLNEKSPNKNIIVPEILNQMALLKKLLKRNEKVSKFLVYVKKCRLCKKVQKESRSKTMMKCQECDSLCFLFQCLVCFKRYTTTNDIFNHINKKHATIVNKEPSLQKIQQPPAKGIKVTSNKCLPTNERFKFKFTGLPTVQKSGNQSLNVSTPSTDALHLDTKETLQPTETSIVSTTLSDIDKHKVNIPLNWTKSVNQPTLFCQLCDYSTKLKRYLQDHIARRHTVPNPKTSPTCSLCGKQYHLLHQLRVHQAYCGKEPQFSCKYCDYKTRHKNVLKCHLQDHMTKNNFKKRSAKPSLSVNNSDGAAQMSDAQFTDSPSHSESGAPETVNNATQSKLDTQFDTIVKNSIDVYCSQCNNRSRALDTKYSCPVCRGQLVYRCKRCNALERRYRNMRKHVSSIHMQFDDLRTACSRCGTYVLNMRTHLRNCGIQGRFVCKICGFGTKYISSYRDHMRIKHQQDRSDWLSCPKCGKMFALRRYLIRHQKIYCDNKANFECAHCDLKTRSKANLIRHLRLLHVETMSDVKFNCPKCAIEYRNLYMFDKHVEECNK